MDDSFAERMRNRALQRLQKNAQILKSSDLNKENINEKVDVKPVIAEHLTIKKSLSHNRMDCDDKETKKTNNTRDFVLSERNCSEEKRDEFYLVPRKKNIFEPEYGEEKREDVYVKHCKNRLANLAGKFKQFEEEDNHVPRRPTAPKQAPVKRRSPEKATSSNIAPKAGKYEPVVSKKKENQLSYIARKPIIQQNHVPAKKEKLDNEVNIVKASNTPEKKVLDQSVVKTLESQGYKRTESDAHLIFDFKKARSVFDSNDRSSSKTENSADPSLLSVAERRKLFERRLRGEETPTTFGFSNSPVAREPERRTPVKNDERSKSPVENHIEANDHFEDSNDSVKSDSSTNSILSKKEEEHKEDVVLNISEETCSSFPDPSNDSQDADVSIYPVLQTVKQVKFVSTPKPGRLYPSMSDLDCDADESSGDEDDDKPSKDNSKFENSFSINENDNSFGRDVLFATNSIFSSFQNSRREEMSELYDKSSTNVLNEVKELISPNNDTSLSLSPVARSSLNSVECPNETASFTYMKAYSDASIHFSPISASDSKNNSKLIAEKLAFEEQVNEEKEEASKKNELDVGTKIKLLEEQIIKEKIMLTQAVRALKLCLSTAFLNSLSHLEAEKVVLLSQLKIVAAQNEIDRIKVENSVLPRSSASNSARGNVILSNIKLPVRMAVIHADLKDDIYNNLLCVVKCDDIVLSTGVVPVTQTNIKQDPECTYVEFGDTICLPNVSSDFKITVEVYNLVVERKDSSNSKQHSSAKKDKKSHHGSKKVKETRIFSRQEDKKLSQSAFQMVGYMIFSLNEVRRHQWILNKQDLYHTPLVGMIMMNLKCNLALTTVQKHGFLTMYEVISGYGAWSRYWFHLSGEKLSFWKYPEEENVKDPIGTFDLKKCNTNLVDVVGIEITMRPHTFMLQFNPSSYLLEFKGLTEEGLLLSADNLEERIAWCLCVSEVLRSVRLWSNAVD